MNWDDVIWISVAILGGLLFRPLFRLLQESEYQRWKEDRLRRMLKGRVTK